ncbi:MFS transporter [Natronoarchaeum mannanilyticum]|uniref:Lysosomal dipeptide transporter MFSD1 n=3 Tax=Natronoarchaeum mannanilyticum TaxID=926360 RepID=A0AAV3TEJ4_9EURY
MFRSIWTDPTKRRWVGWAALAGAFVVVNFHRVSTGVLADTLARTFDTTGAELGLLHSAFFYVYAPMQVFAGVLADRMGTRRVATVGSAVMGVGVVAFAVSPSYLVGFVSRLLIGLGGGVVYIATLRYCANWYRDDEFATVTGLTLSASAVGGLLATTPLAVLVAAVGWRDGLLGVGLLGFVLTGAVLALVRDTPAAADLPPVEGAPEAAEQTLSDVLAGVRAVFARRDTWIMGWMLFFAIGMNFTVMGLWGVPYVVQAYDVSVQTASLYTLVGNAGLVVGSPILGWLSDRLKERTGLILSVAVVYFLAYASIVALGTPPLWYVGAVFFLVMFLLGGFTLSYTVIKERHVAERSGTATGTVNGMGFLGAAVLPGVMGWVLDVFWTGETVAGSRVYTLFGYRVAFGVAAASGLVALGCATWLHLRAREQPRLD